MKESDLYLPVKRYLQSQNYTVKAEILDSDVLAVRGDEEPVIVELKLAVNLNVILQAVDRLGLSSKVYVGVPDWCKVLRGRRKHLIKLFRMLGLGLIAIDTQRNKVEVVVDPGDYRPRKSKHRRERLLREFEQRVGDPNIGGSATRRGIMTAYRQRALAIAAFLDEHGPSKASILAQAVTEPGARDILYRNVYGWFERLSHGIYGLSPRGNREIQLWQKRVADSDS